MSRITHSVSIVILSNSSDRTYCGWCEAAAWNFPVDESTTGDWDLLRLTSKSPSRPQTIFTPATPPMNRMSLLWDSYAALNRANWRKNLLCNAERISPATPMTAPWPEFFYFPSQLNYFHLITIWKFQRLEREEGSSPLDSITRGNRSYISWNSLRDKRRSRGFVSTTMQIHAEGKKRDLKSRNGCSS